MGDKSKIERKPNKPRGFAAMDPAKHREICRKGGKAAPASTRTFSDWRKASKAGQKGGRVTREDREDRAAEALKLKGAP